MSEHRSCVCDGKKKKPYTINKLLYFLCADCREAQQFYLSITPKKKNDANLQRQTSG